MGKNFDWFTIEFNVATFFNSFLGSLRTFKLNVTKTATFAVWEHLKFARFDGSKLNKGIKEFLLRHIKSDVTDEHVCLWIHLTTLLDRGADSDPIDCRVVYSFSATLSLGGIKELKETIAILALSLLINSNDSLIDVVPL